MCGEEAPLDRPARSLSIGIDTRPLIYGASGGIVQNQVGVFRELFRRNPGHKFTIYCTIFNRRLFSEWVDGAELVTIPAYNYYDRLSQQIHNDQVDVLFRSYPGIEPLAFDMARQIVYIPDNQHDFFPEFFSPPDLAYRRRAFAEVLGRAGAVGTISEFSHRSMADMSYCRCTDFFLMAPALQEEHAAGASAQQGDDDLAHIPSGDFFFYPANLWKHKNHKRILGAFRRFRELSGRKDVRFLFTGNPAGWDDIYRHFRDLPVEHLGYVRPQLVGALLAKARAMVFFSLFEGFGIPLLEAFHAGTPVICSNTTSLPEIADDAALFADPIDEEAMAQAMARVITDEPLRQMLIARGKVRLAQYSWSQSAANLMAAIERVAARAKAETSALSVSEPSVEVKDGRTGQPLTVAIVTPSFNQGCFIKRTIDSVLSQSYPYIDYVVVDGGSTDETLDILRSYGDRLNWRSEPDRGQTHAINKGFTLVDGQIRAYLNSDDVLAPGAIERVVAFFQANPSCELLYGRANYIDKSDVVTGEYMTHPLPANLGNDCIICQPAAFWTKRVAQVIGDFNEDLHYAMDYDYWLRIYRAGGDIRYFPEFLASSRLYQETKTMSKRSEVYHEIWGVCAANIGHIPTHYFEGYWYHRLVESGRWLRPFATRLSPLWRIPARLHKYSVLYQKNLLASAFQLKIRIMARRGILPVRLAVAIARRLRRAASPVGSAFSQTVTGVWSDNWCGPQVTIRGRRMGGVMAARLGGRAFADNRLTISLNNTVIAEYDLWGGRVHDLRFDLPFRKGENMIVFTSSSSFTDAANRTLSFEILETDLFGPDDVFRQG